MLRGNGTPGGASVDRTRGRSSRLATPNYSYEKRQRELAKKRKAEEKRQRKQGRENDAPAPAQPDNAAPAPTTGSEPTTGA
jgi:hypothetical protein